MIFPDGCDEPSHKLGTWWASLSAFPDVTYKAASFQAYHTHVEPKYS
jgi:hypothetical protein